MKFKCKECNTSGNLGTINNLKDNTSFLTQQWYKDSNGLIHTLVICLNCGTFHDCKLSFLSLLIGKPYKSNGIITKNNMIKQIENDLLENKNSIMKDLVLKTMGINYKVLKFLVEKKLYDAQFLSDSNPNINSISAEEIETRVKDFFYQYQNFSFDSKQANIEQVNSINELTTTICKSYLDINVLSTVSTTKFHLEFLNCYTDYILKKYNEEIIKYQNRKQQDLSKKYTKYEEEIIKIVEKRVDDLYKNTKPVLGHCHTLWNEQKDILKREYKIDWFTPSEENPNINFD